MDRRSAIAMGAAALAGLAWRPARTRADMFVPLDIGATRTIALWPDLPGTAHRDLAVQILGPDDRAVSGVSRPLLSVFRPAQPDGSALLIIPGGGYLRENIDREGAAIARYFAQRAITTFVLLYRLPGEGWVQRTDVALEDAGRAMQIIRAKAHPYGIDPARVGVVGFSAGAHLATMLALRAGRSDTRPDFMALGYPVVTMMKPYAHEASVEHLLGPNASRAERAAWSCERFVTRDAPPAFVFAAADDPDVPVQNARMLYGTLQAKGVPAELHIFAHGGHSFGLGAPESPPSAWPELFLAWGKSRGYFRG